MKTQSFLKRLAVLTVAVALPIARPIACSAAEPAPAPSGQSGYVLPDTQTWDLTSKDGELYKIFVSKPTVAPPPDGYPVLYVLDGNTIFASFAEARRVQEFSDPNVSNTLIVAVGYPTDKPYDFARRMYDFTPAFPVPMPVSEKPFANWKVGGQEKLVSFLVDRLRPAVGERYPINLNRQALFGHSLGGLFALHVLYQHPEAFHAIVAASPSVYWDDHSILVEEREFAARISKLKGPTALPRLLILAGEREETALELWDAEPLAVRLAPLSAFGFISRIEIFKGETHLTVPSRSVTTALRFAFAWP